MNVLIQSRALSRTPASRGALPVGATASLLPPGEGRDEGLRGMGERALMLLRTSRLYVRVSEDAQLPAAASLRTAGFQPGRAVESRGVCGLGNPQQSRLGSRRYGCQTRAFSLVEVLVVVSLLSLIVLVLMTVFNSTQKAFRAGVTQTDVLEGSRAAMDLLVSDLKLMSPSDATTNNYDGINFSASLNPVDYYLPLVQSLPGSLGGFQRTNLLENLFWLSRQKLNGHDSWVGTGYTVIATNISPLFPLYRFTTNAPASTDPYYLYSQFIVSIQANAFTNTGWSHIIDGVVDFRVQAFDINGYAINASPQYNSGLTINYPNTVFFPPSPAFEFGITNVLFLSNAIPASVEIQMSTLEDAVLRRAASFGGQGISQSNYLSQQVGRTHVFRQRVLLPNVDPSAYP